MYLRMLSALIVAFGTTTTAMALDACSVAHGKAVRAGEDAVQVCHAARTSCLASSPDSSYCGCDQAYYEINDLIPAGTGYQTIFHGNDSPRNGGAFDTVVKGTFACGPSRVVDLFRSLKPHLGSCVNPGFGNPIYPLTGTKRETVDTRFEIGGFPLHMTYDTALKKVGAPSGLPAFGGLWMSSLHRKLRIATGQADISVHRGDGTASTFWLSGSKFVSTTDGRDELFAVSGGYEPPRVSWRPVGLSQAATMED